MGSTAVVFSDPDLLALIFGSVRHLGCLLGLAHLSHAFRAAVEATTREWKILATESAIRGRDARFADTGFYFQRHITVLPCGALCVPDVNNRCLRVLSSDGSLLTTLQHSDMRAPRGPVCDGTYLYAVEAGGQGIHRIPLQGRGDTMCCGLGIFRSTEPENGWPNIIQPDCCTVDRGSLYVSCAGNDLVLVLRADNLLPREYPRLTHPGEIRGPLTGELPSFNRPQGLAACDDALWVCDSGHCRICAFSDGGAKFERTFGRYGQAPGEFIEPRGIAALQRAAELMLVVVEASRVQVMTRHGGPLQVFVPEVVERRPTGLWGVCVEAAGEERSLGPISRERRAFLVNAVGNRCYVLSIRGTA